MGEKTEKATPKKLKDARNKGQVAKSQDFPSAFTFVVSIAITMSMSESIFAEFSNVFHAMYDVIAKPDHEIDLVGSYFLMALEVILTTSLPILIAVVVVGVIVNFLVVGPTFAMEVFKPDIKKFDPIQNLKAKFKLKTLVELIKSVAKITGAGVLIYLVIWDLIPAISQSMKTDITGALAIMSVFLSKTILRIGLFFTAVAALDLAYQRKTFAKEMMMEKFETKQEHKNMEGDPQIKGKRKEIAREIAYSGGPLGDINLAKAVITNPAHIAVAIGYEHGLDPAPYVLARGKNYVAQLIITEAERHDIPIMRNIYLAHQLYDRGKVLEFIPENTYEAVAEILKWIASLQEDVETPT